MRRRPAREIDIFNLSMLDVIASALGAFLILFIIAMQNQSRAQQQAAQTAKELEALQQAMKEVRKELPKQATAAPRALARGMCNVPPGTVDIEVSDWSAEDGDEVRLSQNDRVLVPRLTLVATASSLFSAEKEPARFRLSLSPGVNDLVVEALSNGTKGHNSARIVVKPCRDGKEEEFKVDVDVTEKSYPRTKTITIASQ